MVETRLGSYGAQAFSGKNESGWNIHYDAITVLPDVFGEADAKGDRKIGSIYVPDKTNDDNSGGAQTGILVARGTHAFSECGEDSPQVGDRVMFMRYSGTDYKGDDGQIYWIMLAKCVIASRPAPATPPWPVLVPVDMAPPKRKRKGT